MRRVERRQCLALHGRNTPPDGCHYNLAHIRVAVPRSAFALRLVADNRPLEDCGWRVSCSSRKVSDARERFSRDDFERRGRPRQRPPPTGCPADRRCLLCGRETGLTQRAKSTALDVAREARPWREDQSWWVVGIEEWSSYSWGFTPWFSLRTRPVSCASSSRSCCSLSVLVGSSRVPIPHIRGGAMGHPPRWCRDHRCRADTSLAIVPVHPGRWQQANPGCWSAGVRGPGSHRVSRRVGRAQISVGRTRRRCAGGRARLPHAHPGARRVGRRSVVYLGPDCRWRRAPRSCLRHQEPGAERGIIVASQMLNDATLPGKRRAAS